MKEGQTLKGRYKIIQDLKRGAFGRTYCAEDQLDTNGGLYVVKQLQPNTTNPAILEEARRRFELEASTLEKLGDHDQIPKLLAHFEENQEFYLVQDFVDGQDLSREITDGKRWNETEVVTLLVDVLEVLEYIHQQNVIHRDIKPSNLIRRKSDHKIVLIDFGAVKEIETLVINTSGQTSGSVIGTPGYMPIEHLGGRPRFNSDIYALGMTAIQALTGLLPLKLPRDSQTDELVWRNVVEVNEQLGDILDKMVRSQYRDRYQSATEVLDDLKVVVNELRGLHRIGQLLDRRYKIISLLGDGKFGQTYLALDQRRTDNARCVVKQLKLQANHPTIWREARRIFETEAQVLYSLGKYELIPELLGEFEENQEFYLVWEFIEGEELSKEIARCRLNEEQVISMLQDVLLSLGFAHEQTIHCDIKPANLIRRATDGRVMLTDFGSVKQISTLVLNYQGQLSITNVIGALGYMPKEQQAGNPRPNSDIYALGMTAIHALTGVFPPELGQDPNTGEVNWRSQAQVSDQLAAIINKMVIGYFRSRYESVQEVLNDLRHIHTTSRGANQLEIHPFFELEERDLLELENGRDRPQLPEAKTEEVKSDLAQESQQKPQEIISVSPVKNEDSPVASPNIKEESTPAKLSVVKTTATNSETRWKLKWILLSLGIFVVIMGVGGVLCWPYFQFNYLLNQCNTLIDAEQGEDALQMCDRAIAIKPNEPLALKNQGDALFSLERYEAALVIYDKSLQYKPDFYQAWNQKGQALYKLQRYAEALSAHEKALTIAPTDAKGLNGRGIALIGLGKYDEALLAFDRAIATNPDDSLAWENKGIALGYLHRDQDARSAYKEAIALLDNQLKQTPDNERAYVDRGRVLGKLQRHTEALASYDKAIEINSNFYPAWIGKGSTLFFMQRFQDALTAYDKAVEIRPKYYLPWHNRGGVLSDGLQRYENALASYQKAIDLNPNFYPALRDQGRTLMQLQKFDEAIVAFDKALKISPNDYPSWGSRGIALTQLKRYDEALAAFDKAISINPNDPLAWANRAWALEQWQRFDEAIIAYNKAIELKPDFTPAIAARKVLLDKIKQQ
ncbi:protein kinase [Oscillatoriales cyanobacterium USR001]|nr:protein kinase [Oscillatoriales cyanobacterium USR001]